MLITATGLGWQNVQQHNRSGNEQSASLPGLLGHPRNP